MTPVDWTAVAYGLAVAVSGVVPVLTIRWAARRVR